MAKARSAKYPKSDDPVYTETASVYSDSYKPESKDEVVSKAEAVRRSIAAGCDTPTDGVAYLKTHFNIDMDNKTWSLNRSQVRARERKAEPSTQSVFSGIPASFGNDMKSIKGLIEAAGGADQLKEQISGIIALHEKYGASLITLIDVFG